MQSINEAKKRLLANAGSNILVIVASTLIGIWLTRYLIRHLGLAVYGMIPLVVTIASYFGLLTLAISGAVSRFVAIHLGKEENDESNVYFSTAFFALLALCAVLLFPVAGITLFLPKLFQIPTGYEVEARWLFIFVSLFSFTMAINSPFLVSTFVRHRFDLSNLVNVGGKLFQVGIIALCFTYIAASVIYVGISYFGLALFVLVCSILLTKRLTPELHIRKRLFRWSAVREMGAMGGWITINQLGSALYMSIGVVVINLFLGSEQVGQYAPFVQWVTLLVLMGGTLGRVFYPIAYDYIARNEISELTRQARRSMKFIALMMALPVGLLCGLSAPVLKWWLGPSFAALSPLMLVLVGPRIITLVTQPIFAVTQGMNKVKVPSIVTVIGGVTNLILSIVFVRYTNLGLYGVALATASCLAGKNLFFTPIYGAIILGQRKTTFYRWIILGLLLAAVLSVAGLVMSGIYDLATVPRLVGVGLLMSIVYLPVCYWIIMNKDDRSFLWTLFRKDKAAL